LLVLAGSSLPKGRTKDMFLNVNSEIELAGKMGARHSVPCGGASNGSRRSLILAWGILIEDDHLTNVPSPPTESPPIAPT